MADSLNGGRLFPRLKVDEIDRDDFIEFAAAVNDFTAQSKMRLACDDQVRKRPM